MVLAVIPIFHPYAEPRTAYAPPTNHSSPRVYLRGIPLFSAVGGGLVHGTCFNPIRLQNKPARMTYPSLLTSPLGLVPTPKDANSDPILFGLPGGKFVRSTGKNRDGVKYANHHSCDFDFFRSCQQQSAGTENGTKERYTFTDTATGARI